MTLPRYTIVAEPAPALDEWLRSPAAKSRITQVKHLRARFGSRCGLCGGPIDPDVKYPHPASTQVDHIHPNRLGGETVWGNLQLAHQGCNNEKNGLYLPEPSPALYAALLVAAISRYESPEAHRQFEVERIRLACVREIVGRESMRANYEGIVERNEYGTWGTNVRTWFARHEEKLAALIPQLEEAQRVWNAVNDRLTDVQAVLHRPGEAIEDARKHVENKPGVYAIHGTAEVWAELGIPHRTGPLYIGRALSSLVTRDIKEHFGVGMGPMYPNGYTGGSTVRRTLAALLRDRLGFVARPRRGKTDDANSRDCTNYSVETHSERILTEWMAEHLTFAAWPAPDEMDVEVVKAIETALIDGWLPPLNIDGIPSQKRTPAVITGRAAMRDKARAWAVERGADL